MKADAYVGLLYKTFHENDLFRNEEDEYMLNISGIHEGFVLDHIQAGMSLQIYHDLKLDTLDCCVAIIKIRKSKMLKKNKKIKY